MSNNRLKYLLERYAAGMSTPGETRELFKWIENLNDDSPLKEKLRELWLNSGQMKSIPQIDLNAIYTKRSLFAAIARKSVWLRVAAAALVVITLGLAGYFLFPVHQEKPVACNTTDTVKTELAPGTDRAVLTLANGQQIILDSTGEGTVTQQGNIKVIKLNQGQLSYSQQDGEPQTAQYNTISTPRGGQYQIELSDGTKVWLNAASSLHFPVSFAGDKRAVTLSGEGYFEVAPRKDKPFVVTVRGVEVQVLGTHFNVNAYADESVVKTTLLEGSVRVNKGRSVKLITPGQQAMVEDGDRSSDPGISVQEVDVDAVTAWKNGRFIFKGEDIRSVMRQLARWYNAEVTYEANITREQFVGVINRSRYENINDILEMLEKTGAVSFAVNGKSIRVRPFQK